MNVVDSCGWLEFFAAGPNAGFFAPPLSDASSLIVPSISIYEVFKCVLLRRDESDALEAIALMQQGTIIDFTAAEALAAAKLSIELGLPMADAIMLSTAQAHGATFWTQDAHFSEVSGVRYIPADARHAPATPRCARR
ncbi:MAG: type II toxin-antitoxin system VapC family toxin [Coriobacteriia bacterium]|nr:type II toxin-antitoxin system VapC family toxin [Coriobacteriia bacterium]